MKRKWLRWAWVLPVAELLLAGAVAGVPAARILRMEFTISHQAKTVVTIEPRVVIEMLDKENMQQSMSHHLYAPDKFESISFLNLPGIFPALLIDRFSKSWPEEWSPAWSQVLGMWGWRSISWPLFCLPFWWLAGRGMDAFLASLGDTGLRVVRWYEAWGMALFGTWILVVGTVLMLMTTPDDGFPEMRWLYLPGAMWFVFGLMPLLAWFRQRRAFQKPAEAPAITG